MWQQIKLRPGNDEGGEVARYFSGSRLPDNTESISLPATPLGGRLSHSSDTSFSRSNRRKYSVVTLQEKNDGSFEHSEDDSRSDTLSQSRSSSDGRYDDEDNTSQTFFSVETLRSLLSAVDHGAANGWETFVQSVRLVCQEVVPADSCVLWLLNDEGTGLVTIMEDGTKVPLPLHDMNMITCLEEGTPIIEDARTQGNMIETFGGNWACTRLCVRVGEALSLGTGQCSFQRRSDRCVGILELLDKGSGKRDVFTQQDVLALTASADIIAMAFANVWHAENDILSMNRTQALLDTSKSLMSAVSKGQIFNIVKQEVPMLTGFKVAHMYIYDSDHECLSAEIDDYGPYHIPIKETSAVVKCYLSGVPRCFQSLDSSMPWNPFVDQPAHTNVENMVLIPVKNPTNPGATFGVIQVCNKQDSWVGMLGSKVPSEEDINHLEVLCMHVAVAMHTINIIENATYSHGTVEAYGASISPCNSFKETSCIHSQRTSDGLSEDGGRPCTEEEIIETMRSKMSSYKSTGEFDGGVATLASRPSRLSLGRKLSAPVNTIDPSLLSAILDEEKEQKCGREARLSNSYAFKRPVARDDLDTPPQPDSKPSGDYKRRQRMFSEPLAGADDMADEGVLKLADDKSDMEDMLLEGHGNGERVPLTPDELLSPDLDLLKFSKAQLSSIVLAIFYAYKLPQKFNMDPKTLDAFISEVKVHYQDNPFHNWYHAVTVLHTAFVTVSAIPDIHNFICHLDLLAIFLTALGHDMNHTGQTNAFHIQSMSDLAYQYNDKSILEQHSAAVLFFTLKDPKCNILAELTHEDFMTLRSLILAAIMDTDLAAHGMLLSRFSSLLNVRMTGPGSLEDRKVKCSILVHSADLSNPTRVFDQARTWSLLLAQEMLLQANKERALGIPVAPFMQHLDDPVSLAKNEIHFINTFAKPVWSAMSMRFPALQFRVNCIKANLEEYQGFIAASHSSIYSA